MLMFALSHVVQAHNGMTSARTEALRLQLVELRSQKEYLIEEGCHDADAGRVQRRPACKRSLSLALNF